MKAPTTAQSRDRFVIIMAGGRGARFWPVSREQTPKQLIKLLGDTSFLQQAVARVAPLVPSENIFVITNEVQVMFVTAAGVTPHFKAGRLKALAVTTLKPSALLPDLPTIAETIPGYEYMLWQGIVAPAKTPPAIIAKLNAEVVKALNSPDVREQMAAIGNEPMPSTPEAYAKYINEQVEKMKEIVRLGGIKPQD